MALINCPECGNSPVSDQAPACPKCGYPIKKPEYRSVWVDPSRAASRNELSRLQNEGWQIVDEHDEEMEMLMANSHLSYIS